MLREGLDGGGAVGASDAGDYGVGWSEEIGCCDGETEAWSFVSWTVLVQKREFVELHRGSLTAVGAGDQNCRCRAGHREGRISRVITKLVRSFEGVESDTRRGML